jgi:hypothetical protein
MRDVNVLIQVFVEIETILAEHIQPGNQQDPAAAIEGIFRVMDRAGVSAAVERLATRRAECQKTASVGSLRYPSLTTATLALNRIDFAVGIHRLHYHRKSRTGLFRPPSGLV